MCLMHLLVIRPELAKIVDPLIWRPGFNSFSNCT